MLCIASALLVAGIIASYVSPRRHGLFPLALAGAGVTLFLVIGSVVGTVIRFTNVFGRVAHVAPDDKAMVLSAGISEAMNNFWTSPIAFPLPVVLSIWFLVRARRLARTTAPVPARPPGDGQ